MKPAICNLCGKPRSSEEGKGDWLEFLDYENEEPVMITHPQGLEYYCDEHLEDARRLVHLNSIKVLEKLRQMYPGVGVSNDIRD